MTPRSGEASRAIEDEDGCEKRRTAAQVEALYRAERHSLERYIRRERGRREDAQDLAQDVFFRVIQNGGEGLAALAQPGAYLRRIARNLLRDRAKVSARRHASLHVPYDDQTISDSNEVERYEARDSLARVEAAIRLMKPRTRDIFMAHRREGLTYAEIAERTGLSEKGVEKQMSNALAHLMRHVELD